MKVGITKDRHYDFMKQREVERLDFYLTSKGGIINHVIPLDSDLLDAFSFYKWRFFERAETGIDRTKEEVVLFSLYDSEIDQRGVSLEELKGIKERLQKFQVAARILNE